MSRKLEHCRAQADPIEDQTLILEPEVVDDSASDEADDDFDTPYRPAESIRLPFRESDFPVIMRPLLAASPVTRTAFRKGSGATVA